VRKSTEIREEITELRAEVTAIIDTAESENRELMDDEQARVDEVLAENGLIVKAEANLERAEKIEANKKAAIKAAMGPQIEEVSHRITPAKARRHGRIQSFKSEEDAYLSGQYVMAFVMGNEHSRRWCDDHGIKAAMTTGNNPKGGYLVPEPLEATIVELREQYGVARRECMVVPMSDGNNTWPKLNSELTTYYVGENSAITASDVAIEQVRLEARKLATLTAVSSELNEDSVISVAEMLSRSIAQQFAKAEDQALFLGDGTSNFGGIAGLPSSGGVLNAGSVATAATGNTAFSTLDLADFEACAAALPEYATANAKWYISRSGYWRSMARLVDALGGNTISSVNAGPGEMTFLGYPVVMTQVMPSAAAATINTHLAYLGDLRMGVLFGDRRGISVVADESFYFSQDAVAIRGIERYDINVHERGTATVGGAIIALDTPGS
jgi:HK97 family phage major capsid protein